MKLQVNEMQSLNTPVLLLVFNRPDTTKKVFQKIREAKPPKLYVAADGPRRNKPEEKSTCTKVRQIATEVDWDCEVKTLLRDDNLGCKLAVSGGIDWFFANEDMGIILEDDCLPDPSFFKFCEILLHRYADKEKVMTISGNNFQPVRRTTNSYYFSKYMHCWGWASWRRAWKYYDLEMKGWPKLKQGNFLSDLFNSSKAIRYWEQKFDKVYDKKIDTWDYQWTYSIWKKKGLNIIPEINLVSNIGFNKQATHTVETKSPYANLETNKFSFPLNHPSSIEVEQNADDFLQRYHFQIPIYKKVLNKLKRLGIV